MDLKSKDDRNNSRHPRQLARHTIYNPILPKKTRLSSCLSPSRSPPNPFPQLLSSLMPVFSRIAPPMLDGHEYNSPSEYHHSYSASLPPARVSQRVSSRSIEGDSLPPHHPSAYNHNSRSHGFTSGDFHVSGAPPSSQQTRSRVPMSSEDPYYELIMLNNEKMQLMLESQHLRGQIEAISYASAILDVLTY
jgi:hypothetical protein